MRDKIKGCIYGIAVGDALGAPCEAERPSSIKSRFGIIKDMLGSPSYAPGEFTDDTWLTLAACRAYEKTKFDPERAGECMVIWMRTNGKGIGNLTNIALSHVSSGRETVFNSGKRALGNTGFGRGAGNGSLMRCAATGLVHPPEEIDSIIYESKIISAITHADPKCIASCVGYNVVLSHIVSGNEDARGCIDCASNIVHDINPDTAGIFKGALSNNLKFKVGEMVATGYVLRSLERALTAVLSNGSFEDEIIDIVSEGGDTDTNAAIAGGLLGAKHGFSAIPKRWIVDLKHKDELEEAVELICKFRGL